MATLDDLRELGYQIGVAHGDAQVERDRLAELEALSTSVPDMAEMTAALDRLQEVAAAMPDTPQRTELYEQIDGIRLNVLAVERLNGEVETQRRAVKIAEAMPTVYVLSGPGIERLYLREDDQATIDALADPAAHAERVYQHDNPRAMAAAGAVAAHGFPVDRPDAGADTFTVAGQQKTGSQLVALAKRFADNPPPAQPSIPERVAEVLLTAPEVGEATKAALEQALKPAAPQLP
jgi:hypothetical protein